MDNDKILEDGFYVYFRVRSRSSVETIIAPEDIFEVNGAIIRKLPYSITDCTNGCENCLHQVQQEELGSPITVDNAISFLSKHDQYKQNYPVELFKIIKMNLEYGKTLEYIYRPTIIYDHQYSIDNNGYVNKRDYTDAVTEFDSRYYSHLNQLEILIADLLDIFKTISPHSDNLNVFGHRIRNIILLACTEVDTMLKQIYVSNKGETSTKRYSTQDYVKLNTELKLNFYSVSFVKHLDLPCYTPFRDWNKEEPTKSIGWYNAYNFIKHDRESNFNQATLNNAIISISAFIVVLISQYGYRNRDWKETVGRVVRIDSEPMWNVSEFYYPPQYKQEFCDCCCE